MVLTFFWFGHGVGTGDKDSELKGPAAGAQHDPCIGFAAEVGQSLSGKEMDALDLFQRTIGKI